jgi:hypothetical protein
MTNFPNKTNRFQFHDSFQGHIGGFPLSQELVLPALALDPRCQLRIFWKGTWNIAGKSYKDKRARKKKK